MSGRLIVSTCVMVSLATAVAACGSDENGRSGPSVTFATVPATTVSAAPETLETGATSSEPPSTDGAPSDAVTTTTIIAPTTVVAVAPVPDDSADLGVPAIRLQPIVDTELAVGLSWRNGDQAVYIVEQDGLIIPVNNGIAGEPVLDIRDRTTAADERGLLGMAFHPTEPFAYVNYIANDGDGTGDTVIAEYSVAADGTFDPASRREVMVIDQPHNNHNGGDLAFGPDGYLYIGMGDGGAANDPDRRSLNVADPLGKMLRIDPRPAGDQPYGIPADNPFADVNGALPEIFAVGLRNPWRFSFDRATGDLWIGDVGQGEWEEIDVAWADQGGGNGANFGWSAFEGNHRFNADQSPDGVTPPIFEYRHSLSCSVSGGVRYRGSAIPALAGWYVFADFCSGEVHGLQLAGRTVVQDVLLATVASVAAVEEGPDGELFVVSQAEGLLAIATAG